MEAGELPGWWHTTGGVHAMWLPHPRTLRLEVLVSSFDVAPLKREGGQKALRNAVIKDQPSPAPHSPPVIGPEGAQKGAPQTAGNRPLHNSRRWLVPVRSLLSSGQPAGSGRAWGPVQDRGASVWRAQGLVLVEVTERVVLGRAGF